MCQDKMSDHKEDLILLANLSQESIENSLSIFIS